MTLARELPAQRPSRALRSLEAEIDAVAEAEAKAERLATRFDPPLFNLRVRWFSYTAATRTPLLRPQLPSYRRAARRAIKAYRIWRAQEQAA